MPTPGGGGLSVADQILPGLAVAEVDLDSTHAVIPLRDDQKQDSLGNPSQGGPQPYPGVGRVGGGGQGIGQRLTLTPRLAEGVGGPLTGLGQLLDQPTLLGLEVLDPLADGGAES